MKTNTKIVLASIVGLILLVTIAAFDFQDTYAQVTTSTPKPGQKPTVTPSPSPSGEIVVDDEIEKVDVELVNLNVRVIDRNNRSIGSLKQSDFQVYEDNVLQPVDFFGKSELPTNYAMVIDNSGSLRSQLEKVIEASKVLVGTNRKDDETCLIRFVSSENIEIVQDFTPNKVDLTEALDNLHIDGGQTAIIDAVYLAAEKVEQYEKTKNPNDRKRRALILVTDGEDRSSYYKEQQLFELLRESEVQIYVVGFTNELSAEGGFISKSPQEKAKNFLTRLATETGGKAYFPASVSELNRIAADISNELRTQYIIAYSPTNDKKDGTYRAIKVAVAEGPNKEKRIAVTRAGRTAELENRGKAPALSQPTKPKS